MARAPLPVLASRFLAALVLGALPLGACDCGDEALVDVSAELEVTPSELDFGKVVVGGLKVQSVTLSNLGGSALPLEALRIEGSAELVLAARAPDVLTAGAEVVVNLAYEPRDVGVDEAVLVVAAIGGEPERRVTLKGEGVASGGRVESDNATCGATETSISFGEVGPNLTVERRFSVVAEGTSPMTVLSAVRQPGSSAAFDVDGSALPVTLQPGERLELVATFTPPSGGPFAGAFVLTTDAQANPSITVTTCGTGVAPALCARPSPLDLGGAVPGTTLSADLVVESCGAQPVELSSLALAAGADPGFAITSQPSLPLTMAPGETSTVTVSLTPSSIASYRTHLLLGSTSPDVPELSVPVVARGSMPCGLQVVPSRIVFTGGTANSEKPAVLVNVGSLACTVERVEITSGQTAFNLPAAPALPFTIAPGASVDVIVQHTPTGAMPDMGQLLVEEGGTTTNVDLVGNPDLTDGCHLEVAPPAVAFGAVPPGATRSRTVDLNNIGDDPCFLYGVSIAAGSDPGFVETSPSLGLILPGRSKSLAVTYMPTSRGSATGTLEIRTNDETSSTFSVPLSASSSDATLCVDPTNLAFGDTPGTRDRNITLSACGAQPVTITGLSFSTPDPEFTLFNPPSTPFTLPAGNQQDLTVRYAPADADGDTAVLDIASDDPTGAIKQVRMTGGHEYVPAEAGRYLYYWQIPTIVGGDIMQLPLQGNTTAQPWYGPRTGKACAGCHAVSPDGRYVAVIEAAAFRMVDTTTNIALAIPNNLASPSYISWNPDVNTNPPYQYAYDAGGDIAIGALFQGELRKLQGADDPTWTELMPSWGSNGMIAFARGMQPTQNQNGGNSFGFSGSVDVMVVPATGGTAQPLAGASGDGAAHYYPQYSPNARFIAITESASAQSTIAATDARVRLIAADNSGAVLGLPNLNGSDGASSYPTWSVDGTFLSFSSNRSGGLGDWDIYVAPIDPMTGADQAATNVRDANSANFEHAAQWSP